MGEMTKSPHVILSKNVHIGVNKDKLLLILYSSKTHGKESRSQKVKITSHGSEKHKQKFSCFCPFKLTRDYIKIRGDYWSENKQFFVFSDHSPVSTCQFRRVLKKSLENLNLDYYLYGTHSLRIGRSTDMAKFGYNIDEISRAGRWKSNTVYKYIKA